MTNITVKNRQDPVKLKIAFIERIKYLMTLKQKILYL